MVAHTGVSFFFFFLKKKQKKSSFLTAFMVETELYKDQADTL